jgi:beta-phosphoglucomutase family hydrolase
MMRATGEGGTMTTAGTAAAIDLRRFDAMLFDLDGVITRTAAVHATAWKALFDEFLQERAAAEGTPFQPFEIATDYVRYVDGRRRYDGVATFLASRGIHLPAGEPSDSPDAPTCAGLGNRKNRYFNEALDRHGVEVFDDAVEVVRAVHDLGKGVAVVSASENCVPILEAAGLLDLFPVRVTGVEAAALHLPGKPAPDTFLEAARRLEVPPERGVVFEDAISGVEAGRAGSFGLVVGVDRTGAGALLAEHGADVVLTDLRDLLR